MAAGKDITGTTLGRNTVNFKQGQTLSPTNYAIFQDTGTLRTYLLTQGYTNDQLDKMLKNDLIFAARKKLGVGA